jgi:hypothetical protein
MFSDSESDERKLAPLGVKDDVVNG